MELMKPNKIEDSSIFYSPNASFKEVVSPRDKTGSNQILEADCMALEDTFDSQTRVAVPSFNNKHMEEMHNSSEFRQSELELPQGGQVDMGEIRNMFTHIMSEVNKLTGKVN